MNNTRDQNKSEDKPAPSHPEMMGDETEEQNLNQPGNPKARITEQEVEAAFEKGPGKKQ